MSEDKSSKTEKASPKKLRDAKKKGQVPKSKDVVSITILILIFVFFLFSWSSIQENLKTLMLSPKSFMFLELNVAVSTLVEVIYKNVIFGIILPLSVVTIIGAVIGNILQFGYIFSWDPVKPKMNKISPVSGFKRIFSMKQLKTTAISLLKILAISLVLYFIVLSFLSEALFSLDQCKINCQQGILGHFVKLLIEAILLITLFLSVIDYIVQRASFMKEQKMSKDEQKREYKNMEGDPHIKSKRKQLLHEIANDDIKQKVKDSRIIIYSSGLAIALYYKEGETPLPLITSIGKARMADKMIEIARAEKTPIYESFEVALSIIGNKGAIDQYIPEESITGVVQAMQSTEG